MPSFLLGDTCRRAALLRRAVGVPAEDPSLSTRCAWSAYDVSVANHAVALHRSCAEGRELPNGPIFKRARALRIAYALRTRSSAQSAQNFPQHCKDKEIQNHGSLFDLTCTGA